MQTPCVFCNIISGKIPSAKVYEDEKVLAFLDIKPVNYGHTLIIPKEHYTNMLEAPDEMISYIFQKSKELMRGMKIAVKADFVVLSIVGVDVPHFHIHLVPRYMSDGLANFWPTKEYGEGEMGEVANKIKYQISKIRKLVEIKKLGN